MVQHFREKRSAFERLVAMSNEDYAKTKVIRIANDFTWLQGNWAWPRPPAQWGLTAERWGQYRALFQELQLPAGLQREGYRGDAIRLMVHGVGLAGGGREYGYLYSPSPPVGGTPKTERARLKALGDSWYLYSWSE